MKNFSFFFIDRPRFATVVSLLIVIIGALAYFTLPIAQFPEVAPPTVVVTTAYPGATPDTIAKTLAAPIEQEVNGVEDMLYMNSQSTADGAYSLTVTFKLGTDLDKAQVLVQNRVALAEARLPEAVRRIGVTVQKASPDLLLVVQMFSKDETFDLGYVSNYALLQVRERLRRIDGVGEVRLFGGREYSMRVWLDPERMDFYSLSAGEVVAALRAQNVQIAAGTIGQQPLDKSVPFQINVTAQGRLSEKSEFEKVVVKTGDNRRIVLLKDVARVELGSLDYNVNAYLGNTRTLAMPVFQRPGSNALQTSADIRAAMKEMDADFPEGLDYDIVYDPTQFIDKSVEAVLHTLFEAVLLVVLVMIVFLQSWRAALIPVLAIPVSLIGTFAVMQVFGFSINNLTLFGLVLAIGIVVDDAIVVVENIERNLEDGHPPREAARRSMAEVSGAIFATSLVPARRLRADGFPLRHLWAVLQTVRPHHRRLDDDLRPRLPHPQPGARRSPSPPEKRQTGFRLTRYQFPFRLVFQNLQPWLRPHEQALHRPHKKIPAAWLRDDRSLPRAARNRRLRFQIRSRRIHPTSGPGLRHRGRPAPHRHIAGQDR